MLHAITRAVSPAIVDCELTHLERTPIDLEVARSQHAAYEATIADLGARVQQLPAEPDLPDSVFVEDVAVVLDEVAIITRPGAASRRGERTTIEEALAPHRHLARIGTPGTLDGGDVLVTGRDIAIGISSRSDLEGIEQFRAIAVRHGYRVHAIRVRGCLHLKSAVASVDDDTLLLDPDRIRSDDLPNRRCLTVDPREPDAANVLQLDGTVVAAAAFPRTVDKLVDAGHDVRVVEVSELAKAEGALTCCSLLVDVPQP